VCGLWPERAEANARRRALGPGLAPDGSCHVSAGYTSGWLSGLFEADLLALETGCSATGDASCHFVAREPEAWRAAGDSRATRLLEALPFAAFRDLVRRQEPVRAAERSPEAFDPEAAVIHIWGPVMVLPFSGADEALRAVELIGREPGAREVSVVVLDLSGAVLDEAFGAAALEQILESVESWGAESVLAGVGPLSQRVVAELSHQPLLVHKDLHHAIAASFQIARAQRRNV
jgi:anti-anti-sigma regulatory factor